MRANGRVLGLVGRAAFFAALAAGALCVAGRPMTSGLAADKGDAPPKAAATELEGVPADGVAMISLRFADLWNHAAIKAARDKLTKEAPDVLEHFTKELGVAPEDVERVTGVMLSMESNGNWLAFVTTAKPYDAKKVLAAAAPDATEEKVKDRMLQVGARGAAVSFLGDRTFVVGPAEEVRRYLKQSGEAKEGPLTPALREAAGKHVLVAGVDVETLAKVAPNDPSPVLAALKPLLKARSAVLSLDLGDEARAGARLTFAGEADAKIGEDAANAGLDLARAGLVWALAEAAKQPAMDRVVALMKDFQAGLRAAKVEQKGSAVEAAMTVKIDPEKAGSDLIDAVQKVREQAARIASVNNLKQLALAMHAYNDVYGHFPPAAVYDKNGKALLSWRVLILPYIEQEALYKEFHLDEPWDSDHNKKLLEKMPHVYGAPTEGGKALDNHLTHFQGFVGKGAIFDGKKGAAIADITDGLSNTILFVEAKTPAPWTKPDDVPFDEGKLVPKVGGLFEGIFNAAMGDGSVRSFPLTIKEETLRALITRSGGEAVDPNK